MLLVFGFGCLCGMLLYIALDLETQLRRHRRERQKDDTIRDQENLIRTIQNALYAEQQENRRQAQKGVS